MKTWETRFTGRKLGSIGEFCVLGYVIVEAETREQAIDLAGEKARAKWSEKYEHVQIDRCTEQVKLNAITEEKSDKPLPVKRCELCEGRLGAQNPNSVCENCAHENLYRGWHLDRY